jgi:hypothetical protein
MSGRAGRQWRGGLRASQPLRYNADSLKNGISMKIRTLCIACVTTAAVLLAGCTAVYKNTDACEQMMRSKLADVSPEQLPDIASSKLSVGHRGTGIDGTRVVVEATLSRMQTEEETAASAAQAASAPPPGLSSAAARAKASKPRKLAKNVAAECTFTGLNLASFRWLAPKELLQTSDTAAGDTTE